MCLMKRRLLVALLARRAAAMTNHDIGTDHSNSADMNTATSDIVTAESAALAAAQMSSMQRPPGLVKQRKSQLNGYQMPQDIHA